MITKQQAIDISQSEVLTDIQQLQLIRKYIYDKKGIDVGEIERPIGITDLNLMLIAFDSACRYYLNL